MSGSSRFSSPRSEDGLSPANRKTAVAITITTTQRSPPPSDHHTTQRLPHYPVITTTQRSPPPSDHHHPAITTTQRSPPPSDHHYPAITTTQRSLPPSYAWCTFFYPIFEEKAWDEAMVYGSGVECSNLTPNPKCSWAHLMLLILLAFSSSFCDFSSSEAATNSASICESFSLAASFFSWCVNACVGGRGA